ncbi:MAG: 50S ribosomal protein L22, partial [Actinomycetota bacterium]
MSTATKTNERPGTRAKVRYVRMSASKARVVLNLIRNKPVAEATEILTFSERLAAQAIDKCLRSAVANAVHNDEIPTEELYVSACFADEGPTLKRYRPRARGRAGRIHKQTCHITIVVSRYSEEELDAQRAAAEARGETRSSAGATRDAAADRARRVAKSKASDDASSEADDVTDEVTDTVEDTVEEAADTVEDTVEEAAETVEDTVEEAAETVEDTVEEAAETAEEAAEEAVAEV